MLGVSRHLYHELFRWVIFRERDGAPFLPAHEVLPIARQGDIRSDIALASDWENFVSWEKWRAVSLSKNHPSKKLMIEMSRDAEHILPRSIGASPQQRQ